jgi:hypothetical protein
LDELEDDSQIVSALQAQYPESDPRNLCVRNDGCAASADNCSNVDSMSAADAGCD